MILLVGGEKGGTGKTTLAMHLAILRASSGRDVLVVDADHQGSALGWAQRREVMPRVACVQIFGEGIKREIVDLAKRYDDIIVDSGARDTPELRMAMGVSDIVVSPVCPSQLDVETLDRVQFIIGEITCWNENLKNLIVFNQASTNPAVSEVDAAKRLISEFEQLCVADTIIRSRIAFRKAAIMGLSVTELPQKDAKASNEITALYQEVYHGHEAAQKVG